jgi:hypothetical protein
VNCPHLSIVTAPKSVPQRDEGARLDCLTALPKELLPPLDLLVSNVAQWRLMSFARRTRSCEDTGEFCSARAPLVDRYCPDGLENRETTEAQTKQRLDNCSDIGALRQLLRFGTKLRDLKFLNAFGTGPLEN